MAASKNKKPDFFDEESMDPIEVATGPGASARDSEKSAHFYPGEGGPAKKRRVPPSHKKKAGFYVSVDLLDRFTRKFYELKLAGAAIENKSALLEVALSFALDDLDEGAKSRVMLKLRS